MVTCAAEAIVFILSNQEVNLEAEVEKSNFQVSGGRMWQENEEDDVKFNCENE